MLFVTLEEKTSLFAKTPLFLEGMKGFYRVEKKKEQGNRVSFPCRALLFLSGHRRAFVHAQAITEKTHLLAEGDVLGTGT